MGVDLGGGDILVAKQLLNGADVVAVFQQVRGKAVAQRVRADGFDNSDHNTRPAECA